MADALNLDPILIGALLIVSKALPPINIKTQISAQCHFINQI
jgi:hypothetical protein